MNKLFLTAVVGLFCFGASAQHRKVSEFYLSYFNKDYMVTACPAEYSPLVRFDYEFDAECLGELEMVGVRIPNVRVDRFRNSMNKLAEEYERWCSETESEGKIWEERPSAVNFPKADIYVYTDEGWILKPKMKLRARLKAEDDCRYVILESRDFETAATQGPQTARLIFSSVNEINEFTSSFDHLLTEGIREEAARETALYLKTFEHYTEI